MHTHTQSSHHPNPSYMDQQPKLNHRMRCILTDWLVLVQMKFQLLQETLFLTISIIDRFLEVQDLPRYRDLLSRCLYMS